MPRLLALLALVAIAVPSFAQQPLSESIEVVIASVDVVVTDREGRRVTGLTPGDFELRADDRPQAIVNFHEVRGGEALRGTSGDDVPVAVPRRFVFFFDVQSLHPSTRSNLITAVRRFIDERLRPPDLAAIVAWNGRLRVVAPFTSDRQELARAVGSVAAERLPIDHRTALGRVQKQCTSAIHSGVPMVAAYLDCINTARGETEKMALQSRQLLNAIELAARTMSGTDARKILVLVGAVLPRDPGVELYQWANEQFLPLMRSFDAPLMLPHQAETQLEFLEKAARSANSRGVALYTIAATRSTNSSTVDTAQAVGDGGADFLHQGNTFDAYATLATLTGATTMKRPTDLNAALASVADDLDAYYSLGFKPATVGGTHAIAVRMKNPALTARVRRDHTVRSADDVMSDKVVANVFMPAEVSAWPVRLETARPAKSGATFTVPVTVVFPSELTLLPDGSGLAGAFTVYLVVGTSQGALSDVFRKADVVRIEAGEERTFRGRPITFDATVTLRPGENIISVGVVDQVSGATSFGRRIVVAE